MAEIVELFQDDYACHLYRREAGRWSFEALGGVDAILSLESIGVQLSLADIYALAVMPTREPEG